MRYVARGVMICVLVGMGSAAQAQAIDPQVVAPINKFIEAFNKGDMAGAAATHSSKGDIVIIDEVPPFLWRGAKALQAWGGDLEVEAKQRGLTDQKVTLSAPTRAEIHGDAAYVVVPAVYTFNEKGVAMRETAQMTFSLQKDAKGWLIDAWTWTGGKPRQLAAASKK